MEGGRNRRRRGMVSLQSLYVHEPDQLVDQATVSGDGGRPETRCKHVGCAARQHSSHPNNRSAGLCTSSIPLQLQRIIQKARTLNLSRLCHHKSAARLSRTLKSLIRFNTERG